MIVKPPDVEAVPASLKIVLRCPGCQLASHFSETPIQDLRLFSRGDPTGWAGFRQCPVCHTLISFVRDKHNQELATYPEPLIDFDATNLPPAILGAFEEAIGCHAHRYYKASAIMVRKTLELLCVDKNAGSGSLKERLAKLRDQVVIPEALLDAANELRLLGNDAAHMEYKDFPNVGDQEVQAAIGFTKEILKGVYQFEKLVQDLRNLKKS